MKYLGTAFSLTLGAWRLRVRIDLEDEPLTGTPAIHAAHLPHGRVRERA